MRLQSSEFPLVWMYRNGVPEHPEGGAFGDFESLLARQTPFVFLSDEAEGAAEHDHSHEERKKVAQWMKKNRTAIRTFVQGSIQVEPDAAKRVAAQAGASGFERFWGYPSFTVATRAEAIQLAQRLLAGTSAGQLLSAQQ